MPPSVYVETSVLSYLAARPARDVIAVARQQLTAGWWAARRGEFTLYVSELVLREAGAGDSDAARRRLALVSGLSVLRVTDEAAELGAELLRAARLPAKAAADALHVAVAAAHGVDYLLTWNVRHIANARTRRRVEDACRARGYAPPVLCTPEELTTAEEAQ